MGASCEDSRWKDVLVAEGFPLTCRMEVHLKNGGIKCVLVNGKPFSIHKTPRDVVVDLVKRFIFVHHGGSGWLIDANDLARHRRNELSVVKIDFHNGTPSGRKRLRRAAEVLDRDFSTPPDEDSGFDGFPVEQ